MRKQSRIRRTRGDVCFLRGEIHGALDHYLSSAAFYKPFDEQEMVALLEELAGTIYEAGRMSIDPPFFVAAELIEAALAVKHVSESPRRKAEFSFRLGLIYRNAGVASSSAEKAQYVDKAILHTRAALTGLNQPKDHFTLISAKIGLGNCLIDKAKIENDLDTLQSAILLFEDVKQEIEQSGKSTELLGHAYNNLAGALMEIHLIAQTEVTDQTLDEVLIAYQAAIRVSEANNDIANWGAAKANYGYRLAHKARLESTKEKEAVFLRIQSISAFLAALETYPSTLFPRQYAETHIGLADVLVQQGQNSNENLIELHFFRALGSYSGACEIYFTKDRHPIRWAELQKKLGNIFAIHAQLEGTESTHSDLEQSIEHIENARRIFRQHNISAEIEACDRALKTLSELVEEPSDAE